MRSKLLFGALALAIAGGISTASADTLVHMTFTWATGPGPGGVGVTNTNADIYIDVYATPSITANNFLSYVTSGAYTNSIIHRSIPGFVIQGGGFKFDTAGDNTTFDFVPTNTPIPLQYTVPNIRGTLSMARTSDPNSATSQFFINTVDNTTTLGPGGSSADGYAVFGNVLNAASLANVDAIAAISTYNASSAFPSSVSSNFTNLPLTQGSLNYPYFVNMTAVSVAAKIGDINLDGKVNIDDFLALDYSLLHPAANWGANNFATGWAKGDLNLDGTVDATDYAMLQAAYQQANSPLSADDPLLAAAPPIVIPEPASLTLLATGTLLFLKRKRK